jgi:hypothetical protein
MRVDEREPQGRDLAPEFGWRNELSPVMRATRQQPKYVLSSDDTKKKWLFGILCG